MISTISGPSKPTLNPAAPFDKGWVPQGYTGPVALPGTGRIIYWTGRIAIGLRYAPSERVSH
jgi:hypothetical protein